MPILSALRWSKAVLLALSATACAPRVDVVVEFPADAPAVSAMEASARRAIPGTGRGPVSFGKGSIKEPVPVVAEGPGRWAVRDLPRSRPARWDPQQLMPREPHGPRVARRAS